MIRVDPSGYFWGRLIVGGLVGGAIELATQLYDNGGDFNDVNWKKVGVATAEGAFTAVLGPFGSTIASGLFSGVDSYLDGDSQGDIIKSTLIGAGSNLIGYGVGKATSKWGMKTELNTLAKKILEQLRRKC